MFLLSSYTFLLCVMFLLLANDTCSFCVMLMQTCGQTDDKVFVDLYVICLGVLTYNIYSFRLMSKVIYTNILFLGLLSIMHVLYIFTFVFVQHH